MDVRSDGPADPHTAGQGTPAADPHTAGQGTMAADPPRQAAGPGAPAAADPGPVASRWGTIQPWLGTVARLVLAGVFVYAAATKITDLAASGRAVAAYRILPFEVAKMVGAALPFVELAVAVLLVLGLATRVAAVVSGALLAVFIAGISSAWARGLSIDCGCFGGDGSLAAGRSPNYGPEIARDAALLVLAFFLIVLPRTRLSLDAHILGSEDSE